MKKDYLEILKCIKESYNKETFDNDRFEFYETRREKNKYSTGIIKFNDNKYYFKIVKPDEYINNEEKISKMLKPNFEIVEKYGELENGNEIINLYKYISAPKINAFNYLRDSKIDYNTKKQKMDKFFFNKIELMKRNYEVAIMDGTRSADRWFWGRIKTDPRTKKYYGTNFEKLYEDISKTCPNLLEKFKLFLEGLNDYLSSENLTVTTYCHGDFHDFNFSLDGIFWDIDTFDFNPILNDFTTFYWHFYAREDYLIYKYCPWLTGYMYDSLDKEELKIIREEKKNIIYKWYDEIESAFEKYKIKSNINKEFTFKLFCRIFLINNVLEYDIKDRIKNYHFFYYYLSNENANLKELLFSSNILFERYL